MAPRLPDTSLSLLSQLRNDADPLGWQVSWKRFLELYNAPLLSIAAKLYRHHTGDAAPPQEVLEDVVANVVVDFFQKNRFDPQRGRLRTYLRLLTNARLVDMLRKHRPLDHQSTSGKETADGMEALPDESSEESVLFRQSLLATLIEDLREQIPLRHFEIFELVKLKGQAPEEVARDLGVSRGVVDNTVYKVMLRLREIASSPEYQEEYYP